MIRVPFNRPFATRRGDRLHPGRNRGPEILRRRQLYRARNQNRLLSILGHLGAKHYISGPSAKEYMELDKFEAAGIGVEFVTYSYPEYPQLHGAFEPAVTILDLIFNTGPEAPKYIWKQS